MAERIFYNVATLLQLLLIPGSYFPSLFVPQEIIKLNFLQFLCLSVFPLLDILILSDYHHICIYSYILVFANVYITIQNLVMAVLAIYINNIVCILT